MRSVCKFAFFLTFLMFMQTASSNNLFSRLNPRVSNQNFEPLENVSFFIECKSDDQIHARYSIKGKTFMCNADETGSCFPKICWACPANSAVNISAKHYSKEKKQIIQNWQGYEDETDATWITNQCIPQRSLPSNDLEPFIFNTYDLSIIVKNENEEKIKGAKITANSPFAFYYECATDNEGKCEIKNIPENATYNIRAGFNGVENETKVIVTKDMIIENLLAKKPEESIPKENTTPIIVPPEQNATIYRNDSKQNYSVNWFEYLMDKTDELIGKEKSKTPKLKLVFVPIGYNDSEYGEFKNIANESVKRFSIVSPLNECAEPLKKISTIIIKPSYCNLTGCISMAKDCQSMVLDCALNFTKEFDKAIGICKGISCGNRSGKCGSAKDIPSKTAVINAEACSSVVAPYKTIIHEMGHTFGLYHVKSQSGLNGCWDDELGACQGPNADDCKLSNESISKNIMAYCPNREEFGPGGYNFLRNISLNKYLGGCT